MDTNGDDSADTHYSKIDFGISDHFTSLSAIHTHKPLLFGVVINEWPLQI